MSPHLRQQFEAFLLSLAQWEHPEQRHALVAGILRGHVIWKDLKLRGSAATSVVHLLDLYEPHGPDPFRTLLSGLREMNKAHPEHCAKIDALDAELRTLSIKRKPVPWKDEAPFRGLRHFDHKHAPIYFGRDAEVEALIQTMATTQQGRQFTVVVGASGSGKSSLVRAGLWARLRAGKVPELPGSEKWLISAMKPNDTLKESLKRSIDGHPIFEDKEELATRMDQYSISELTELLLHPNKDARWLLILDQMEELFAADKKEAGSAFLDCLLEATQPPSRFQVLATLRSDFFHYCMEHPPLQRAVGREGGTFLLGKPGRLSLERMVSGPLTEVELPSPWFLDPALPPTIAADAEGHSGGLALMAFALRELYDLAKPNCRMDLATYRSAAFGGLGGAIARRADATLQALGEGSTTTLERVFVRLVRVNQDDSATRLREHRSAWKDDPKASELITAFEKARLLVSDQNVSGDPTIEVAHEALLREWPTLAGWINQRREAFRLADRVKTEALAWQKTDPQFLSRPWAAHVIEDIRNRLVHYLLNDPVVAKLLMREEDWILGEIARETTTHARRRDIGQRLAEIGDPRRGVGAINGLPDILWRPIPGGPVEPFHMAAYPVTFIQFRAFLDAKDGFNNKKWWKDLKRENPDDAWQSPLGNHPVTDVSWFDATAFCLWLSARLGYTVRLPDEYEWQWAARSARKDFDYPWGSKWRSDAANTDESEIRRTTAVGMYPQGASLSPMIVSDLAGNVWEWCINEYKKGEESRVLRGGSWVNGQEGARAECRFNFLPQFRSYYFGFRVVSLSPSR